MAVIGAYEAKTHLPAILQKVQNGEYFLITKHGVPIAELSPVGKKSKNQIQDAISQLKEFQQGRKLGALKIKDMIAEGRRS